MLTWLAALGATTGAVVYLIYAHLGYKWRRTKSQSWLHTMSQTEGYTDVALSAARVYKGIIEHPRRHQIIGSILSVFAGLLWMLFIIQTLA